MSVCVCVCMFDESRSGCMYDLGDCICANVPTGNAPFFFLLFCNFKLEVKPTTPAIPKEHHSRGFR